MKSVHKYQLTITDSQKIVLPIKAKILSVQIQNNIPCIWALVDTDYDMEKRTISMFGTGHPVDENLELQFIGTIHHSQGLVFHVFEML